MPLHLLGKKSWNVYNSANIERVRRDEAEAEAREEAEEQRLQQEDAARRTKLLRGELPVEVQNDVGPDDLERTRDERDRPGHRRRRRLHGEDDTDRDIRWAREDADAGREAAAVLSKRAKPTPLYDQDGHIQLVPVPDAKETSKIEQNAELEAEKARKKKQDEDQYTMRFSNAAGFKNNMQAPWYAERAEKATNEISTMPEKDVWGNEDPRRREREQRRVVSNDPLAFMQQAQRQLKQSARDKERWQEERAAELRELERDQRKHRHRAKHDLDDLEPLSLDAQSSDSHRHRKRHRKHHRRSRSR